MTTVEEKLQSLERSRRRRQALSIVGVGVVLTLFYFGLQYVNFQFYELLGQLGYWSKWLQAFLTPNFVDFSSFSIENEATGWGGILGTLGFVLTNPLGGLDMLLETFTADRQSTLLGLAFTTIVIGFCGTVLGFPFALLFGVLGSERVVPFPFNFIFRSVMSLIRSVPALVWIFIYVPLAGISPVSAVLAIGTDTIGILGRLFTDELEEIEEGPIEAIRSTGGNSRQIVSFGMLSQVSTAFIAWTLYSLEINVRVAVSLGIVGAGGIGRYIYIKRTLFDFGLMAAGILMIIFVVLSVELTSTRIRARLRPGEHDSPGLLDILRSLTDASKWLGMAPSRPGEDAASADDESTGDGAAADGEEPDD